MEPGDLHPWNASLAEAAEIQIRLSRLVKLQDEFEEVHTVCGIGLSFKTESNQVTAAAALLSFPELKLIQSQVKSQPLVFPYTSGYLAFSAGPTILELFKEFPKPDLVIFPGRGVIHPRGLGLASHLGVWLDLPTLACSKRPIFRDYPVPAQRRGSFLPLLGKESKLGAVLRTQSKTKSIFVSVGHKLSLSSAIDIVLRCCTKHRLPEPLRVAGILARRSDTYSDL